MGLAALLMDEVCNKISFLEKDLNDIYWGVVMVRSDENVLARCTALKAGIPDQQ